MADALKILLVMTAERRSAVMSFLSPWSWETRHASDCRQTRDLLRREQFDLVLTDASLPDGNWLTILCETNRGDAPPALVVCLPRQAERLGAIHGAGHVQVLMPPLDGETIRAVLEEALRRQHAPAELLTVEPRCAPLPA
jgi:DNA-binding response OmpR family regulator